MSEESLRYGRPRRPPRAEAFADEVVRHCRTCKRDTAQQDMIDTLDATHYVCTVCGGSEIVPESAEYGE